MTAEHTRRDFLATLAATAAVASLTSYAPPAGAAGSFDDTWTARIRAAKHKAVFDSPEVSDGLALTQASLYRAGYAEVHGADGADIAPVVVFRHAGILLAFDDALWEKYAIGEWKTLDDPSTKQPARRNPWARPGRAAESGSSIEELRAAGVTFLACQLAMNKRAEQIAKRVGADVEAVRAEVRANLVRGMILQPSGIYATARAQEVGCVFMRST
jgi:intracellular sulfur oxidation DsrE/DsrF family protein